MPPSRLVIDVTAIFASAPIPAATPARNSARNPSRRFSPLHGVEGRESQLDTYRPEVATPFISGTTSPQNQRQPWQRRPRRRREHQRSEPPLSPWVKPPVRAASGTRRPSRSSCSARVLRPKRTVRRCFPGRRDRRRSPHVLRRRGSPYRAGSAISRRIGRRKLRLGRRGRRCRRRCRSMVVPVPALLQSIPARPSRWEV